MCYYQTDPVWLENAPCGVRRGFGSLQVRFWLLLERTRDGLLTEDLKLTEVHPFICICWFRWLSAKRTDIAQWWAGPYGPCHLWSLPDSQGPFQCSIWVFRRVQHYGENAATLLPSIPKSFTLRLISVESVQSLRARVASADVTNRCRLVIQRTQSLGFLPAIITILVTIFKWFPHPASHRTTDQVTCLMRPMYVFSHLPNDRT